MDSKWLAANKAYVNSLVRDFANPSSKDTYYPMWRSFDWYHGHSWAHGLTAMWDGKVSPEDGFVMLRQDTDSHGRTRNLARRTSCLCMPSRCGVK